jgi:hypothetical protein
MNGKVVPIQVRLAFELVSIIGEHIQEKKELKPSRVCYTKNYPDNKSQQYCPYY